MPKTSYSRYTIAAAKLLGNLVRSERKAKRITAQELAERLGVARSTVQRLELGNPKVELGLAFDACALLGIRLFDEDSNGVAARLDEIGKRAALLPKHVRQKHSVADDDF